MRTMTRIAMVLVCVQGMAQPNVVVQPVDFSVSLGANVTHQVTATGSGPLDYQWRFEEDDLAHATNRSLVLTNVQVTHAGGYSVVVTDSFGSTVSRVATLDVDPTFIKITSGDIVAATGEAWGCSWGDYDNDGFIDLYVTNSRGNSLFRNNGDGTFTRITSSPVVTNPTGGSGAAWGDYDNDGDLDLISGGFAGSLNAVYRNDGDGVFTRLGVDDAGVLVSSGGSANAVSLADYDNDGWLDVFAANHNFGNDELFRGSASGLFTRVTGTPLSQDGATSLMGVWADYDNDGDLDLMVTTHGDSPSHRVFLYRNDGDAGFTTLTTHETGDVFSIFGGAGCAWGDYDNDGDLDVFIAPHRGHDDSLTDHILARNNGDGTFTRMTTDHVGPIAAGTTSMACAWADYDNDGYLDLFVSNNGGHPGKPRGSGNRLYHNNGDGTFTAITTGSIVNEPAWSWGAAWGDYDNDGFMDLFVANGGTQQQENFIYRNGGNANHWLKLRLAGTSSNRSAIGAKVRVRATIRGQSVWQMREISGGDSFMSQQDMRPNFGLGDAAVAETVRIEWPSGIVQELEDVAADQILEVTEPARLAALVAQANGLFELEIGGWPGSVYDLEASNDLRVWTHLTTLTNETGTVSFTDPLANGAAERYYRAVGH